MDWFLECYCDLMGLSIDSLVDVGYFGVVEFGDVVCGMVVVKIILKDFFFWFRYISCW